MCPVECSTSTRYSSAFSSKSGKILWETRLGYGGSPRNVPAAIVPDIKIPQSGQALYVFALPDGK
jgi:hypothetical protein